MANPPRTLAFILAPTDQGTLIVNRFDFRLQGDGQGIGVGHMLLSQAAYDQDAVAAARALLGLRRHDCGNGVVAGVVGDEIGRVHH